MQRMSECVSYFCASASSPGSTGGPPVIVGRWPTKYFFGEPPKTTGQRPVFPGED